MPQRAVQQGITGQYVFVVGDSNKTAIRPVQAANWQGSQWVINSGLKAGDRVVVDGTQKIFFPGAPVTPVAYVATRDSSGVPTDDPIAAPSVPMVRDRRN